MRIIGITGSSGAGKSTLSEIISNMYDTYVINADELAKEMYKNGTEYYNSIVKEFGKNILAKNKEIDKSKLSEKIYSNENERKILNNLTFYYLTIEIKKIIEKEKMHKIIIIDAPLLFESNLDKLCDVIIGVITEKKLQVSRICKRDNINEEKANIRLNIQKSDAFFLKNCDFIIPPDKDKEYMKTQIKSIEKII